jgi:LysR family glycine cleavage system transcriptional activator
MSQSQFKLPPLEWIRAFEAAARCGSFTAAAAETGITQSAVSQRIGQLEKQLGTALFQRNARSITLTIQGEAWLPHVKSALDGMRDSSEALFGAGRRRLTVSASQSVIELWLLSRIDRLCEIAGGQLAVQTLVLGGHDAPLDDVIRIRYGSGDWPHAYKLPLYPECIAPMASVEVAKNPGHWTQWPRIACSGPRPGWQDWASHFGTPTTPVPHLRFDTFLSGLGAARSGLGVLLGSLPLCKADLAAGRLVLVGEDVLDHHETYWIVAGKDAVSRLQWEEITAAMC